MNRCHRLVFSRRRGAPVPAPETARSRCGRAPRARRLLAAALLAAAPVGAQQLPVPCAGSGACGVNPTPNLPFVQSGSASYAVNGPNAVINQTTQRAILNWQRFDIGAGNSVQFNQPGAGAATLNRIWQADPSVIAGRLSANGQVYLYNQNGIVFARGAQVNTAGLVASALNIRDDLFNSPNGLLSVPDGSQPMFTWEGGADRYAVTSIRIEDGARIDGGNGIVMVLAPKVENNGTITTRDGQIVLAAGAKVYLTAPPDIAAATLPESSPFRGLAGLLVEVDPFEGADAAGSPVTLGGEVFNQALGKIVAERGNATLVALAVNQQGRVSATTSVRAKGSVRLLARDTKSGADVLGTPVLSASRPGTLELGPGSVTEVLPDLTETVTSTADQLFNPSTIELAGRTVHLRDGAQVRAPGGFVTAEAARSGAPAPDNGRIYLAPGSVIDAAGTGPAAYAYWNELAAALGAAPLAAGELVLPVERNFVPVDLRGNELRDSPLQRAGALRGETVWVDLRKGTEIADVSGFAALVGRTVAERSAAGGSVTLRADGDIVLREGSRVDVSGGYVRYADGFGRTSTLVTPDGQLFDITTAPKDRVYAGVADTFIVDYARFGIRETFFAAGRGRFEPGHLEGRDAGTIRLAAPALALDGALEGRRTAGVFQRDPVRTPLAGRLVVGDAAQLGQDVPNFLTPALTFSAQARLLDAAFAFADPLPQAWSRELVLFAPALQRGGLGRLEFYADGPVTLPSGVALTLPEGGSLTAVAARAEVAGEIRAPGGTVALTSTFVAGNASYADTGVRIAPGGLISTAGRWLNDTPLAGVAVRDQPAFIDGGAITLASISSLTLEAGSVLDVSGGARLDRDGRLRAGDGGAIALRANSGQPSSQQIAAPLVLAGERRGYAPGRGGSLSVAAARVTIGGVPVGGAGELHLGEAFFREGGFADYSLSGRDGLTVAAGAIVAPRVETVQVGSAASSRPSGADLRQFSALAELAPELRRPTRVSLSAVNAAGRPELRVGEGAAIVTEPGGEIALRASGQLTVEGRLEAPAGRITLTMTGDPGGPTDSGFDPRQSTWLGARAQLLARGVTRYAPSPLGLRTGEILDGGSVVIDAAKGYVVAESGALIDVSGASGVFDLVTAEGGVTARRPVTLHGAAGSIEIASREGILLDATLAGGAGPGAHAGRLALTLDRAGRIPFFGGYPSQDRRVIVSPAGAFVPPGLAPGDALDSATYNGIARVAVERVAAGGFGELALRAENAIEFSGDVVLALPRAIELLAPVVAAQGAATARVQAPYATLANRGATALLQAPAAPSGGAGRLTLQAELIDLEGNVALRGFGDTRLASAGDIRGKDVVVSFSEGGETRFRLAGGSLATGGDLTLAADQIYPATLSRFAFVVADAGGAPAGRITTLPGEGASPVASALGSLTLSAAEIDHRGVVKAPFGTVALEAADRLRLAPGSVASVSGDGQAVPFGRTQLAGADFVYDLGTFTQPIPALPEKTVRLAGAAVTLEAGATLDVSGGGDLLAYEFVPGPGGSRDVLAPREAGGAFAIVPGLAGGFAPFDLQESAGLTGLNPGDRVFLSGGPGLAAGVYTVLPARYALLDGGYLVQAAPGTLDRLPQRNTVLADGSALVAGQRLRAGDTRDPRSTGFVVSTSAVARQLAEYTITRGSDFFARAGAGPVPGDAGRVTIAAASALALDGTVTAARQAGFRGAELDIAARRVALLAPGAAAPGPDFVVLDPRAIGAIGASSVLIGGRRETADGEVRVAVQADEVYVANSAADPLAAPEVLLAAGERVEVAAGSVIVATGAFDAGAAPRLRIGSQADGVDGDGALLAVSSRALAAPLREIVDRDRGVLDVRAGARLAAAGAVVLDATRDNFSQASVDTGGSGALVVGAGRISLGETAGVVEGLAFDNAQLAAFDGLARLALRSYTTVDLHGVLALGNPAIDLAIEAGGLAGYANADGANDAHIRAARFTLANPDGSAPSAAPPRADGSVPVPGTGTLEIAAGTVVLGGGAAAELADAVPVSIAGFGATRIAAAGALLAEGTGRLTAAGDLTLAAASLTGATGGAYRIEAGGTLRGESAAAAATPDAAGIGARLELAGARVDFGGRVDLPSGSVTLEATGGAAGDTLRIAPGARIAAGGAAFALGDQSVYTDAGEVRLVARGGGVELAAGSRIDVAAAAAGDAGRVSVAAAGDLVAEGELAGAAADGYRSGAFSADLGTAAGFAGANAALERGGFREARAFRVRAGGLEVAAGETVRAREIALGADQGAVTIHGTLDASGAAGGRVAVWARDHVTLASGARIDASGSDGRGGAVTLGASAPVTAPGAGAGVSVEAGGRVDLSGADAASGGTLVARASRVGLTDVGVRIAPGTVTGAGEIVVEALRGYDVAPNAAGVAGIGASAGPNRISTAAVASDTAAYMANAAAIKSQVGLAPGDFSLRPGVEIRSAGDLRLESDWNLFLASRPGGEPGVLTLRAGGDLRLDGSLSDGFNGTLATSRVQETSSWSYRLVAGADAAAADPLAVRPAGELLRAGSPVGSVVLGSGRIVRTGTGAIDIAAGRSLELAGSASAIYTAGRPVPLVPNFTRPPASVGRAEYLTEGGDIRVRVQEDIVAPPATQLVTPWLYRQGALDAEGNLIASLRPSWWIRIDEFRQGIAALGGGDVTVSAGGDIRNLSVSVPTTGRLPGPAGSPPDAAALLRAGGGDLEVSAGGDIGSGIFYVGEGAGRVRAGGDINAARTDLQGNPIHTLLALGEATMDVRGRGDVTIESVLNPTLLEQAPGNVEALNVERRSYFFTYGADSGVRIASDTGDAKLSNAAGNVARVFGLPVQSAGTTVIYPASLRVEAPLGSIVTGQAFVMAPAAAGRLALLAGEDVRLGGTLNMSDVAPARLPAPARPDTALGTSAVSTLLLSFPTGGAEAHDPQLLHRDDPEPARIVAAAGDIVGLAQGVTALLPKPLEATAGRDVRDFGVFGQNLREGDVSVIAAGRDVAFSTNRNADGNVTGNNNSFQWGGPGRLHVRAGRTVDLASALGILTVGNRDNPFLPEAGASIHVLAGGAPAPDYGAFVARYVASAGAETGGRDYLPALADYLSKLTGSVPPGADEALAAFAALPPDRQTAFVNEVFFTELRIAGRAAVDPASPLFQDFRRGDELIETLFPRALDPAASPFRGDLNLFFSQIRTEQGGDIDLLVPGGLVNAGLAISGGLAKNPADLGIVTVGGGSVRAFARDDFQVNQSRVFTLAGGDILIWSALGNIDAGRGAKTASATPPPQLRIRDGRIFFDISQSVSGSGIGVLLTRDDIAPGDVDLIAPRGEVNAGDAGIRSAGNLTIAALRVVGADNIQVGGVSAGVPVAAPAAAPAAPASSIADVAKSTEQVTRGIAEAAQAGQDLAEAFRPTFITVEVLGYGE